MNQAVQKNTLYVGNLQIFMSSMLWKLFIIIIAIKGTRIHVYLLGVPGGLAEEVNESILHAAFIPFGDIKDVKTPLDHATQKHRSFGFVTFLEREDASAAMDNMDGAELYGRVLTVNYALPEKIKGGEQGWAAQPSKLLLFS